MGINPIEIKGLWDKGNALDKHIISSTVVGENVYGHSIFDTERTELGELLFLFKNRNRFDCLDKIIDLIKPFLLNWEDLKTVNAIIPVPPTNKNRLYQPAFEIALAISELLNISFFDDVLEKTSSI